MRNQTKPLHLMRHIFHWLRPAIDRKNGRWDDITNSEKQVKRNQGKENRTIHRHPWLRTLLQWRQFCLAEEKNRKMMMMMMIERILDRLLLPWIEIRWSRVYVLVNAFSNVIDINSIFFNSKLKFEV